MPDSKQRLAHLKHFERGKYNRVETTKKKLSPLLKALVEQGRLYDEARDRLITELKLARTEDVLGELGERWQAEIERVREGSTLDATFYRREVTATMTAPDAPLPKGCVQVSLDEDGKIVTKTVE